MFAAWARLCYEFGIWTTEGFFSNEHEERLCEIIYQQIIPHKYSDNLYIITYFYFLNKHWFFSLILIFCQCRLKNVLHAVQTYPLHPTFKHINKSESIIPSGEVKISIRTFLTHTILLFDPFLAVSLPWRHYIWYILESHVTIRTSCTVRGGHYNLLSQICNLYE